MPIVESIARLGILSFVDVVVSCSALFTVAVLSATEVRLIAIGFAIC